MWIRSGVKLLLITLRHSRHNHIIPLLVLHLWNAGTFDFDQNWNFTIHFTTFLSFSLCNAPMSGYRQASSFSFRIKCQCTHWNSWFYPLKIGRTPQNIYPAIKRTQKLSCRMYFHSQPCILPITSHIDVIFIIIICVERQNVVAKSDILTMFHNLKPRTILISTRGRSIPLLFLQLILKLIIFQVVRAKKQ